MTIQFAGSVKQARAQALANAIDAAGVAGNIILYPSPRPNTGAAPAGDFLASVPLNFPCATVNATGLHMAGGTSTQATGQGVATWARIVDGNGNFVMDCDVRQADDMSRAAEIVLDIAAMNPGAFVNLTAGSILEGG